jgi:hypothetical protein
MEHDPKQDPSKGPDHHPHAPHGIPPAATDDEPKGTPSDRHEVENAAHEDKPDAKQH